MSSERNLYLHLFVSQFYVKNQGISYELLNGAHVIKGFGAIRNDEKPIPREVNRTLKCCLCFGLHSLYRT